MTEQFPEQTNGEIGGGSDLVEDREVNAGTVPQRSGRRRRHHGRCVSAPPGGGGPDEAATDSGAGEAAAQRRRRRHARRVCASGAVAVAVASACVGLGVFAELGAAWLWLPFRGAV